MRLSNAVPVSAPPGEVFALVNDVERVVSCMPGAALDGREGDDGWRGRVKVKVGPITAAYAGTVRFLEVDEAARTLRVQARGADTHGSGDAEAAVRLEVAEAPGGSSELRLETDLVIRGKIAQFGKGAVATVSDKILQQFARNLGALLTDQETQHPATAPAASTPRPTPSAPAPAPLAADDELDGLAMFAGPALTKYGPVVGAFAFGLFEGWLLARAFPRRKR
ncbi:SRPBCC family protein [Streptomyces sp. NPDC048172]|uniref:SRPBCC family protein n=1 Tax=Streptomyces sp. NPDC048172 TaxID=3365505 RepID=UPI00371F98C3